MDMISSLINNLPSPWGTASLAVIVYLVFHYIGVKTNSSYGLSGRIWNIFIGNKKFNDTTIQDFHDEVQDVDQFNFRYNTKAINNTEITEFKKWLEEKNYNIREISRIGDYFDIKKLEVKETNDAFTFAMFLLLAISIPVNILLFTPAISFGAITTLPESNKIFIISTDRAISLGANFSVHKEDCDFKKIDKKQLLHLSQLKSHELDSICSTFNDEAFKRVITSLKHIELFFCFIGFGLAIVLFKIAKNINQRINARYFRLKHKLDRKEKPD